MKARCVLFRGKRMTLVAEKNTVRPVSPLNMTGRDELELGLHLLFIHIIMHLI